MEQVKTRIDAKNRVQNVLRNYIRIQTLNYLKIIEQQIHPAKSIVWMRKMSVILYITLKMGAQTVRG